MNRNSEPTIIKVGRLADGLSGVVQERMAVKVSGGGLSGWPDSRSCLSAGTSKGQFWTFPGRH